jgi:DNA-directed RNA polymerase specialized sigma24 family protein
MSARRPSRSVVAVDRAAALELLPDTYAAALRLRDAGLEAGEIGRQLGIAPEAVASALVLAEAKLQRLVAESP